MNQRLIHACCIPKILKIAGTRNYIIMSRNFVLRTEEVVGQTIRQLKIFQGLMYRRQKMNNLFRDDESKIDSPTRFNVVNNVVQRC